MRVVVFGNNRVAEQIYSWLKFIGEEVIGIAEGKDHVKTATDWEEPFASADMTGSINDASFTAQPDLLVCARGSEIVKPEILKAPRLGTVNIHYGCLPQYRGCNPLVWAILNGDPYAFVTLHWMTEELDAGPVIAAEPIVMDSKTAFELYKEANLLAVSMFQRHYSSICAGVIGFDQKISSNQARYYAKNDIDFMRDCVVRRTMDFEMRHRVIRAFTFPPYQMPIYEPFFDPSHVEPLGGEVNAEVSDG